MVFLLLTWVLYLGGLVYLGVRGDYLLAVGWLVGLPAGLWLYVRAFPRISHLLGYGRVDDVSLPESLGEGVGERAASGSAAREAREVRQARSPRRSESAPAPEVVFYSAVACPFCPIVEERLDELRRRLDFRLRKVDVTLKPGLRKEKAIRSVPVVEVGDRRTVGHATTAELAALITAPEDEGESPGPA